MTTPGSGKRSIDYRDPRLLSAMLGALYDADGPTEEKPFLELFSSTRKPDGSPRWQERTVKSSLVELVDFGAVRRLTPLRNPVALRLTHLGRAWIDRELEPYLKGFEDNPEE